MAEYEFHPLADLFPLIDGEEFDALASDIERRTAYTSRLRCSGERFSTDVIDIEHSTGSASRSVNITSKSWKRRHRPEWRSRLPRTRTQRARARVRISKNIHRRHLSADQKRELVTKLLKAKPGAPNNAIANEVKVDDKTVAKVRRDLETRSEIPNVETRTDTRGRKQPARKKAVAPPEQPVEHQLPSHGIEPCTENDLNDDDKQTMWRRGMVSRAREAIGHATFEDRSEFTVDDELVQIVEQAAAAWSGVAAYLNRLRLGQRALVNEAAASNDDGFDISH